MHSLAQQFIVAWDLDCSNKGVIVTQFQYIQCFYIGTDVSSELCCAFKTVASGKLYGMRRIAVQLTKCSLLPKCGMTYIGGTNCTKIVDVWLLKFQFNHKLTIHSVCAWIHQSPTQLFTALFMVIQECAGSVGTFEARQRCHQKYPLWTWSWPSRSILYLGWDLGRTVDISCWTRKVALMDHESRKATGGPFCVVPSLVHTLFGFTDNLLTDWGHRVPSFRLAYRKCDSLPGAEKNTMLILCIFHLLHAFYVIANILTVLFYENNINTTTEHVIFFSRICETASKIIGTVSVNK